MSAGQFGPAIFLLEIYLEEISIQVCKGICIVITFLMHFWTATNQKYFTCSTIGDKLNKLQCNHMKKCSVFIMNDYTCQYLVTRFPYCFSYYCYMTKKFMKLSSLFCVFVYVCVHVCMYICMYVEKWKGMYSNGK